MEDSKNRILNLREKIWLSILWTVSLVCLAIAIGVYVTCQPVTVSFLDVDQ